MVRHYESLHVQQGFVCNFWYVMLYKRSKFAFVQERYQEHLRWFCLDQEHIFWIVASSFFYRSFRAGSVDSILMAWNSRLAFEVKPAYIVCCTPLLCKPSIGSESRVEDHNSHCLIPVSTRLCKCWSRWKAAKKKRVRVRNRTRRGTGLQWQMFRVQTHQRFWAEDTIPHTRC